MVNRGAGGESSPTLTNVTFAGNSATTDGGAMVNSGFGGESNPMLTNVTFAGNWAGSNGGAMVNSGAGGESSPTLTNVTFAGNWAGSNGGAIYSQGLFGQSSLTLTNVILWDNSAGYSGDVMHNSYATAVIAYSLVQGGWDGSGVVNISSSVTDGGHNIDVDPLFVTPVDPAGAPTTAGDLRLRPGSPAIDAGDNGALPPDLTTDLDGNPRLRDGDNDDTPVVDMGAYEFISPVINIGLAPASVTEDNGPAMIVTFTRTQNNAGELVVAFDVGGTAAFSDDYAQSGAASFDGSSGSVTFGAGAITHTLLLTPTADFIAEPDETVTLTLNASATYTVGVPASATGTILNDDTAGVLVSPNTGLTTTEAGGTARFTVTLQSEPAGAVTVTLTSSDPSEGTVSPAALTFDAGNWQTAQPVTVTGVDDAGDDGDVTYTVELTTSSDDPSYDGTAAPAVTVTNLDDDDPPPAGYQAYLPLLFGPPPGLPDLVVQELSVSSDNITVVIANAGESAVVAPFWVDVYIDPDPAPTAVNQTWPMLSEEGLAWGVTGAALPLQPGASLTLTIGDDYFVPDASHFSGAIAAGTPLYAQVDSAHSGTDYGAVLEAHEESGAPYNNIVGPVMPAATVTVELAPPGTNERQKENHLPLPQRPE